jgi:hypothetical protein
VAGKVGESVVVDVDDLPHLTSAKPVDSAGS